MNEYIDSIERKEGKSTVYEVSATGRPSFDLVNSVKSYHAEETGVDYGNLVGRKVAENRYAGYFIVVVVELTD